MFPFISARERYDFGYRNNKPQGRFDAYKAELDDHSRAECGFPVALRGSSVWQVPKQDKGSGGEDDEHGRGEDVSKDLQEAMAKYQALAEQTGKDGMPVATGRTEQTSQGWSDYKMLVNSAGTAGRQHHQKHGNSS